MNRRIFGKLLGKIAITYGLSNFISLPALSVQAESYSLNSFNTKPVKNNPQLFSNFIPLECNQYALRLALTVAIDPGVNVNPYILCSRQRGMGGTHLHNAIMAEYKNKGMRIKTINYSEMSSMMVVPEDKVLKIEALVNDYDALFIDNHAFIYYKLSKHQRYKTINEYLGLIKAFVEANKQVVIATTQDNHRGQWEFIQKIAEIPGSKIAFIENMKEADKYKITDYFFRDYGLSISATQIEIMANYKCENIMQLKGIISRIRTFSDCYNVSISEAIKNV